MKENIKKTGFYLLVVIVIFAGQFLMNHGLKTGSPPVISQQTIAGEEAMTIIKKGSAIIYFWAEWCGVCKMMQPVISNVAEDRPVITIAVKSGDNSTVQKYLDNNTLNWQVVNDPAGDIAEQYLAQGVPSIFFLNKQGEIVLTTTGYTSEFGLRLRLWLASY